MKCAIISVSEEGARVGAKLAPLLPLDVDLYEREGKGSGMQATYFSRTASLTADIFHHYDLLVYIMAVGIVVRSIAPHIQDKTRDPAVVVLDEKGIHAISLLSGHLGGANEWTQKISAVIDAHPVITTATDVHGFFAPDVLARHLQAKIDPLPMLKPINAAVARGERIVYFIDERMALAEDIKRKASEDRITCYSLYDDKAPIYDVAVVISDRNDIRFSGTHLFLRPPTLVVGIGCRRNTPASLLHSAIEDACGQAGRSPLSVAEFTSVTLKQDEVGLLEVADTYQRTISFYTPAEIESVICKYGIKESAFVKETIGVGNVCETTVILKTGVNQLLVRKTKYKGVTVAIAEATYL